MPDIEIKGLSKGFEEGSSWRQVLSEVDLRIVRGEAIALLGRSGSGKSTLLNLIGAIDLPDAGSILVGGRDLSRMSDKTRTLWRRREVGFIYQLFHLLPTLTVAENIGLMLELNGLAKAAAANRVDQLLAQVGLQDRARSFPDQLSGGEQQRVAIARAVAHRPGLILADEPTGNLDLETGQQVLALLLQLVRDEGASLITVTHSLAVAQRSDRLLTLEQGKLVEHAGGFAW